MKTGVQKVRDRFPVVNDALSSALFPAENPIKGWQLWVETGHMPRIAKFTHLDPDLYEKYHIQGSQRKAQPFSRGKMPSCPRTKRRRKGTTDCGLHSRRAPNGKGFSR